jgi:chemotaxis protein CheD
MASPPQIHVEPGRLYLARAPAILETILGSCVAISFWSRTLRAGALCHGILPKCPGGGGGVDSHRYVDESIRYLAAKFDRLGVPRHDLEIRAFGGADVLPVLASRADRPTVGALNCRAALDVLAEERLPVLASDLRGVEGRFIRFDTGTGEVRVSRLRKWNPSENLGHFRVSE